MIVTLLPSSLAAPTPLQHLTSYLVNDVVAIDAGALGLWGLPQQQGRIRHVFLTHTHLDHIASLPMFLENAYLAHPDSVTIYGHPEALDALHHFVFNDQIWPDFLAISAGLPGKELLRTTPIHDGESVTVEGLTLTAVAMNHVIPTLGYFVSEGAATVLVASDTGPTDHIWDVARRDPTLKALFIEAAFPNHETELAHLAKHLTPALLDIELGKLDRDDVDVYAVHLKPRYQETILHELAALGRPRLRVAQFGHNYVID